MTCSREAGHFVTYVSRYANKLTEVESRMFVWLR